MFHRLSGHFFHARIVNRQDRHALQLPEEVREPDSSHAKRERHVHPRKTHISAAECRQDHPVHIHEAHHQNEQSHDQQRTRSSFYVTEQKQKKREEKTQDDEKQPDVPPNAFHPADVPGNFIGKISAPDDQKLREFHIGPQHHKRKQKAAQVLELRGLHNL